MVGQSSVSEHPSPRSWILGPAGRTDYVAVYVACGADAGILDLEDATPEAEKANHRAALVGAADGLLVGDLRLFIRTNGVGTTHFEADVEAAALIGVDGIVVPSLTGGEDVRRVREAISGSGMASTTLVGGIGTAVGVLDAPDICSAGLDYVYFDAEDFATDLGGLRTADNHECAVARSMVRIAAAAAGIGAIDHVVADVEDLDRFRREAVEARNMGFCGKLCVHPSQVALANSAFGPTEEEAIWAQGVVDAASDAAREGHGAVVHDGNAIDASVVLRARMLLARFGGKR